MSQTAQKKSWFSRRASVIDQKIRTFRVRGDCYYATRLPGRKRIGLVRENGGGITPVAYFCDVEEAERFLDWLDGVAAMVEGG